MIKLKKFLFKNIKGIGSYALVTYNGITEPTWFTRYNGERGDWFLESPCSLIKLLKVEEEINTFCKNYVGENVILDSETNEYDYIENHVKPMIIDGYLYEIENFQCSPYLPKKVQDIKLINERECLEYILKNIKNK